MGEIFLARLEGAAGFEKLFVVKRILPHLADDARFRQMLIAEARLAAKLNHANICQVYELGETDGQLYIVMEYLEGITILPLLRKASKESGSLDFGFIGGVIQQTSDALHYAHELKDRGGEDIGIVHRDVTPSNVFLTDAGVVKVLDFGIAKVKDASSNTQTGTVKGKYAYMSPEQLRGASLDRRADVFALGVVVFEMIALRRLFQRKTDYLTFRAVMEQPIPDVRRYRPDVPDALADTLARALDRDPSKRFDTARQFGAAILDAMPAGRRPWTQGEIGDFVGSNFSDEITKRSAQVATAINRSSAGQRSTMPLIAHDDTNQPELDGDDDEFPSVDDTVHETPYEIREGRPSFVAGEFTGVTPPPFGVEPSTSGHGLQLLHRTGAAMPQAVTPKQRSLVWPLLAIAMVAVAGAALFLVWKQTQQGTTVVNVTTTPDPDHIERTPGHVETPVEPKDAGPAAGSTGSDSGGSGSGSGAGSGTKSGSGKSPIDKRLPKSDPYTDALRVHRPEINKCAQDHGAPPAGVRVVIDVSVDGHAKNISLEPTGLNTTPLGTCIKNVLGGTTFPTAKDEKQVSVTFKTS